MEDSATIVLNPSEDRILGIRHERTFSILESDPEEWARNNSLKKTMLHKANLLSRMGLGTRAFGSLSGEYKNRMSQYQEREKRKIEEEERSINEVLITPGQTYSNVDGDFSLTLFERSDNEMRQCYINKLVNMKILKLEPSRKHQSLIIFDWDDTLLCTSFLLKLGVIDTNSEVMKSISPLDEAGAQLLLKAVGSGEVYLVTNSEEGWVEYSGKFFMPKTLDVIVKNNIQIISARTRFQRRFPTDNHRWKQEAFLELKKKYDSNVITNLICLGDSNIEMDAAHIMAKQFSQVMTKTVKFKENPQPEELLKQIELVSEKFDTIFTKLRNLTVRLEKRGNGIK